MIKNSSLKIIVLNGLLLTLGLSAMEWHGRDMESYKRKGMMLGGINENRANHVVFNKEYEPALIWAVKYGGVTVVQELLTYKTTTVDVRDSVGDTPLLCAADRGCTAMIAVLLNNKADINAFNKQGNSALMRAASHNHIDTVQMLLWHNINREAKDIYGNTALMVAARAGYPEIVRLLLNEKATVDTINQRGDSALDMAVCHNYDGIARLLIRAGGDFNTLHTKDPMMRQMVLSKTHGEIRVSPRKKDVEKRTSHTLTRVDSFLYKTGEFKLVMAGSLVSIVDGYVEEDQNYTKDEQRGERCAFKGRVDKQVHDLLLHAAAHGDVGMVREALKHGACVDRGDEDGKTSLLVAAHKGHVRVVALLLDRGALVDVEDEDGCTPLSAAIEHGHREVVRILLAHNASIDRKNKYGHTPYRRALACGSKEIVQMVVEHSIMISAESRSMQGCARELVSDKMSAPELYDDAADTGWVLVN